MVANSYFFGKKIYCNFEEIVFWVHFRKKRVPPENTTHVTYFSKAITDLY